MGGRKVGWCEPPNLICQHLAMQPARQHVDGVSQLRRVATLLAGTHRNDEAQVPRSIRTPWDGMGGRKDGWSEPPELIHGGQAMTTQWVYLPTMPSKAKAGEGGSFLELPSLAVVKNSLMMKQRLVTEN